MVSGKTEEEAGIALESLIAENGNHGEELLTLPTVQRGNKEYVVVVTDGRPELQAAADYLQQTLSGLVKLPKNSLELIVLQVPNVDVALQTYYEHPLDVALIVAEKRGPVSSGRRIKYVLDEFDHLVWTGVVDAYTVRDIKTPKSVGERVTEIDQQQLAKTIALELKEMRSLFRKPVYRLSNEERRQLENQRRRRIDGILLEDGDYVIHGMGVQKQVASLDEMDTDIGMLITSIMFPLRAGEIDTATARWQRARTRFNTPELSGITTFGLDQSVGGGYVVSDLTKLAKGGKPVFGLKRAPHLEEAENYKAAADFHTSLAELNSGHVHTSKGRMRQIWQLARLNFPRVIGVLPDEKEAGVVFMEYKGLPIYPISVLQPGLPRILEELIAYSKEEGEQGKLAAQLIDNISVTAAIKQGFWNANPYVDTPPYNPEERQRYYATREALLFSQASSLGLVRLTESELERIAAFFGYLNAQLKLRPEDVALRLDMRLEHLGFDVGEKLLPSAKDVMYGVQDGGAISQQAVDETLVFYDTGGKMHLVPLHHELSHLKEHPLLMWTDKQTQRYTAISLASRQMFEALKVGNGTLKWYDVLNSVITTQPHEFNLQEAAVKIPNLQQFGTNEMIIDVYRDAEEARQILAMRLPRLYARQDRRHPEPEHAKLIDGTIAVRIEHFNYYVRRAMGHLKTELPAQIQLPPDQQGNYTLTINALNELAEVKAMPKEQLVKLWDGF